MKVAFFPILALAALISAAKTSQAQTQVTRFTLGGHIDFAEPMEEFRANVDQGWGAGAYLLYDLDRRGILSLRLDFNYAAYGRESKRVPLSNTVGGRVLVDVVTTNSLFAFGLGAQSSAEPHSVHALVFGRFSSHRGES